jgi:hypothetical protein
MGGLASLHYSTIQSVAALILLAPLMPSVIGAPQIQVAQYLNQPFSVPAFEQLYFMFLKATLVKKHIISSNDRIQIKCYSCLST